MGVLLFYLLRPIGSGRRQLCYNAVHIGLYVEIYVIKIPVII